MCINVKTAWKEWKNKRNQTVSVSLLYIHQVCSEKYCVLWRSRSECWEFLDLQYRYKHFQRLGSFSTICQPSKLQPPTFLRSVSQRSGSDSCIQLHFHQLTNSVINLYLISSAKIHPRCFLLRVVEYLISDLTCGLNSSHLCSFWLKKEHVKL